MLEMHVSDVCEDNATIGLNVIQSNGDHYHIEVTTALNVENLKIMCLTHFLKDPLVSVKTANNYKLVSVQKKKTLSEDLTLSDEQLSDGMDLLLLDRYPIKRKSGEASESLTAPTAQDINDATEGLANKNCDRISAEVSNTVDFQKELRRIMVSLIDYSIDLLQTHPQVEPIFGDLNFESDVAFNEEDNEKDGTDRELLKQLTDMGFGVERAKRALKLNNMSAIDAMDWLLANESAFESSSSSSSLRTSSESAVCEPSKTAYNSMTGLCPRVPVIVERYRKYRRKQFKANPKALKGLCDMGFDEKEVMDALNVHSNNEIAACEWLLSERRPKLQDLEIGLSDKSPIYRSIVSNAVIQLGLLKPRVFFAFLQLVEEPNSTGRWLSDSQMSPILSQMFRIFHSEKHAIED